VTATIERPVELDVDELDPESGLEPEPGPPGEETRAVRLNAVALAAVLSGTAPAFLVARLFRGGLSPYLATLVGVAVGGGVTWLSYRTRRPSTLQLLVLPVSALAGALLVMPAATGGSANLPNLVSEALRSGGLRQAPIAFDPGWRFVCVVVLAVTVSATMALAVSLARPKLVALVPIPLTVGAALIQPSGAEVTSGVVAMVFVIGGLLVGYGAELGADGSVGSSFELRRIARGGALFGAVMVVLVVLAQSDFLFPASDRDDVIPPQKPPPPQAQKDRELFVVGSDKPGPWRLGVLDVYDNNAFLLPPVDPRRIDEVAASGEVATTSRPTYDVRFEISDLPGHVLPSPAGAVGVDDTDTDLEWDPRTGVFKVRNTRISEGLSYIVTAEVPPSAKELSTAPPPSAEILEEFAAAPPAPDAVAQILAEMPANLGPFDRLQGVRQTLYSNVVAAGAGKPVDISPEQVSNMLAGGEATPYEITAAEVLLARWAGIPARIGYGFYGGDAKDGVISFRPRDGAAWLETYFEGFGWVPVVGTPPRAKASLSKEEKNEDPRVVATDELAITVYVPVRRDDIRLLFELVRYWLMLLGPFVLGVASIVYGYPAALKALRSRKRARWALARGSTARVAVAYAELRDRAHDLNAGDVHATPLEFVELIDDDDEHLELAWLVTRALWGDLRRDLRLEDVEAAEEMAASVRRRLTREQTGLNRFLALVARTSLRDPYSTEVPNVQRPRLRRRARAVAAAGALVVASSCAGGPSQAPDAFLRLPDRIVPSSADNLTFTREADLEAKYTDAGDDAMVTGGQVFTVRGNDSIEGTLQVALFKPDVDVRIRRLQEEIETGLGAAKGVTRHLGLARVRVLTLPEQTLYLWFPGGHNVMELFVIRKTYENADALVEQVIAHQRRLQRSLEASK
jgi:hypothetical protein